MPDQKRYMLLTGASRGIGHATVKLFQEHADILEKWQNKVRYLLVWFTKIPQSPADGFRARRDCFSGRPER